MAFCKRSARSRLDLAGQTQARDPKLAAPLGQPPYTLAHESGLIDASLPRNHQIRPAQMMLKLCGISEQIKTRLESSIEKCSQSKSQSAGGPGAGSLRQIFPKIARDGFGQISQAALSQRKIPLSQPLLWPI